MRVVLDDDWSQDGAYVRLLIEDDQGKLDVDLRVSEELFNEVVGDLGDLAVDLLREELEPSGPRGPDVGL